MDGRNEGDLIEEMGFDRKAVFGINKQPYPVDLMRGIIIHIRSAEKKQGSKNILIAMLEQLLSETGLDEKKRILAEEYGMIMTTELEGRIQTMCNLSEDLIERATERVRQNSRLSPMVIQRRSF